MTLDTAWHHHQQEAEQAAAQLRTTTTIRERCGQLLERARRGESTWFELDEAKLDDAAHQVAEVTRRRFPKLHSVPFHSRWRHFEAGGVDRRKQLDELLHAKTHVQRAHALIDLAVVSVLLDAGAGPDWAYTEPATEETFTRSEGLAVASFHAFTSGLFSSDKEHPLQVDAHGLRGLSTDHLAPAFQVREDNPLVALENRAILLRRLGEVMLEQPETFGPEVCRPAGIFDMILGIGGPDIPRTADVAAHDILSHLLMGLAPIWPASNSIRGVPLGDCWRHSAVRGPGLTDGWVPFHKLTQWMTYSLLEPFMWAGCTVHGLDQLTALPEYRNGGLLLDTGVLKLRDAGVAANVWQPGDEVVVEWRALTLSLLDELAPRVRSRLHLDERQMPLASVLEGGTWAAGRELAYQLRNGLPPLQVASDGTVF
ncbi:URC4/urg3 family protein [Ramlibacter albus]|uniref:URC4/urg3 family protein n=1 Tax=Ramlibacter albus TaxID=2079448 RepID=A0A923M5E7_9BURK|nr:URC4/urg3 family protein [Ramlibacter albus]MBC5764532.1 URC4/urg3 family protein [Ramlibacter albus]